MEIATVALLLSILSAFVSLVSLVRTRKIAQFNSQMQLWTWRQKFLQSLGGLSHQVNQAQIKLSREQNRLDQIKETLNRISQLHPAPIEQMEMLSEKIAQADLLYLQKTQDLAEYERAIEELWENSSPTADLDAAVQQQARKTQNILDSVDASAVTLEEHHRAIRSWLSA